MPIAIELATKFGTADKFLVTALREVSGLPGVLRHMKPENLDLEDVTLPVTIMRNKAAQNNKQFGTDAWTPRKVDKVCWRLGHDLT